MKRYLFHTIGKMPVTDVKPLDILPVLKKIEGNKHYDIAHRVLGYTTNIFDYAVITGRLQYNPAISLGKALKPVPDNHYKTIESSDLGRFLTELNALHTSAQNKIAVKLLLAIALRTDELRRVKWTFIRWKTRELVIPSELMKMKNSHIVPLSSYALELLQELKDLTGYNEYILPSQQYRLNNYMCENTINNVIKKLPLKVNL